MSEPRSVAADAVEVVPGVWSWSVADDRLGGAISAAHAVRGERGTILVDPLPLAPAAFARLGDVAGIVLTAACHQRSAWRLRSELGVPVAAPAGARGTDERPDWRYGAGDRVGGGLVAVPTPGPEDAHHALLREGPPGVLITGDLIMEDAGALVLVPPEHHDDPAATRRSVEALLGLRFDIVCLAHGTPVGDHPRERLRALLSPS